MNYRVLMFSLGVAYAVVGLLCLFLPSHLVVALNFVPEVFQFMNPLPVESSPLWSSMTAGFLFTMATLSFFSGSAPKIKSLAVVHVTSKGFTIAIFLILFFEGQQYFGYLMLAGIDAIITLLIFWFGLRALMINKKNESNELLASDSIETRGDNSDFQHHP